MDPIQISPYHTILPTGAQFFSLYTPFSLMLFAFGLLLGTWYVIYVPNQYIFLYFIFFFKVKKIMLMLI